VCKGWNRAFFAAAALVLAAGGVAAVVASRHHDGGQAARSAQPRHEPLMARDTRTIVAGPHDGPVPILMYHVIGVPPADAAYPQLFVRPADFTGQMTWLARRGYHGVTLRRLYDYWHKGYALPPHPIVISFDDGYLSQHKRALPALSKLHWPGVLNLKVQSLKSDYDLPPWRVRDLIRAGWEIDAHTITHADLTAVDAKRLWHEVRGSRLELQRRFHIPVDFFCYPAGRYDARVIASVRRAGYVGATTTNYGLARPARPFELSRIRINGSDGVTGFARKLEDLVQ
jgi:peptidoglycan/xylan/chitin deacetylase (PgdA/CDA1 family)